MMMELKFLANNLRSMSNIVKNEMRTVRFLQSEGFRIVRGAAIMSTLYAGW